MANPCQPTEIDATYSICARKPLPKPIELVCGWGAFALPLLLVAVIYATWLLAYVVLGVPPQPGIYDPKSFGSVKLGCASELCILMLIASSAIARGGMLAQFLVLCSPPGNRMWFEASVVIRWITLLL